MFGTRVCANVDYSWINSVRLTIVLFASGYTRYLVSQIILFQTQRVGIDARTTVHIWSVLCKDSHLLDLFMDPKKIYRKTLSQDLVSLGLKEITGKGGSATLIPNMTRRIAARANSSRNGDRVAQVAKVIPTLLIMSIYLVT